MKLLDKKLLVKAIMYRILAFAIIFFISYILIKEFKISFTIAIFELLIKTVIYYVYELAWKKEMEEIQNNEDTKRI